MARIRLKKFHVSDFSRETFSSAYVQSFSTELELYIERKFVDERMRGRGRRWGEGKVEREGGQGVRVFGRGQMLN
jgi:hypothetical protein